MNRAGSFTSHQSTRSRASRAGSALSRASSRQSNRSRAESARSRASSRQSIRSRAESARSKASQGSSQAESRRSRDDREKERKYGKKLPYDEEFRGPLEKRSCTDVCCCITIAVFALTFIVIGLWAFALGDASQLLYPSDSDGNLCGVGAFEDRPNLFFFDLAECADQALSSVVLGCPTPQVCVRDCPSENWAYQSNHVSGSDCSKFICKYDVGPACDSNRDMQELVDSGACASYYLTSVSFAGRCVPEVTDTGLQQLQETYNVSVVKQRLEDGSGYLSSLLNAQGYGHKILQDLRASWWLITIGLITAMVLSGLWILLLSILAGAFVWFTIFVFLGGFALIAGYSFYEYDYLRKYPKNSGNFIFTTNLDYYMNLKDTWLAIGIICLLVFIIILVVVLFLRKRIRIAVALIRSASKAIIRMLLILFFPLLPWVGLVLLFGYWGASAIYLASIGEKEYSNHNGSSYEQTVDNILSSVPCEASRNSTTDSICAFVKFGGKTYTVYLQIFQFIMLLWFATFIVDVGRLSVAGAFASYYWTRDKKRGMPKYPVAVAFYRAVRYHLGTTAFGALIINFVLIIRGTLEFVQRRLEKRNNRIATTVLGCCRCCFWCIEKFLKFINRNAYVETAIFGTNFCRSAQRAFKLIMRNILRAAILDKVVDFVLIVGKLVIVGGNVAVAWYFFSGEAYKTISSDLISDWVEGFTPRLHYYFVPIFIVGIGSYAIASLFFSVFGMGVDTLFLCFLEDLERNEEHEYYMSKELAKILGVYTKPEVKQEEKEAVVEMGEETETETESSEDEDDRETR